jgi:hypothetical protein
MSDFPTDQLPLFITTYSSFGPSVKGGSSGTLLPGSFAWVANQAVYMPVFLPWEYPVKRVWWANGATNTTSNVDFGIYTPSGQRLYSTGSTVMGTVNVPQYVTPAVPFVLPAGQYYFAYVNDNTTNRAFGNAVATAANGALSGLLSQASALPLPATATFATYVTPGMVLCGVTRTESGF